MPLADVPQAFWNSLATAPQRLLLLDYDGTLAPHQVDRDFASPYPEVVPALEAIQQAGDTRLVIISGRALDDLLRLLPLRPLPECWGSHGLERVTSDGQRWNFELSAKQTKAVRDSLNWSRAAGFGPDRIEPKPFGVAFHWRGLPAKKIPALRKQVSAAWGLLAKRSGMELHSFAGGLELRPAGHGKGNVINELLSRQATNVVPAYLGDDLTDEDAFAALKHGLGVLVRPEPRATRAQVWLKPPDELVEFLHKWNEYAGRSV